MFLLYQKKYKTFPEEAAIDGQVFHINADFRNILRILSLVDDIYIPDDKKFDKLKEWFYDSELPEDIITDDATCAFVDFLKTSDTSAVNLNDFFDDTDDKEQQFCYNFDAGEIYAGFLSAYGIDLIDVDFLHWYKFKILLDNLPPESAFKRKIELRFMDLSIFSSEARKFTELSYAKNSVQIPARIAQTNEESQETQEFNNIWGKAGNK